METESNSECETASESEDQDNPWTPLLEEAKEKSDPEHKKIMETKDQFVDDGFDAEETLEAAVDKRKYLFKRLLENVQFSQEHNSDSD